MKVCDKEVQIQGKFIRVAKLAGDGYEFLKDQDAALKNLRESSARIDLFTFTQELSSTSPKFKYPMEWEALAALPVSTFDEWWTKQINDKTRNMVRRAGKKGVVVEEVPFDDALVRGISAIYNECPTRQGKRFWHYGKDLDTVRKENGTFLERSVFIGAYLGENLIGFAKLVSDEDQGQASLMQIVSMIQHRDKAPTNALIAQAVRSCVQRGIPYLVYAAFSYGKKQSDGLSDFKENNGFKRIEIPRYYVPLTTLGKLAFCLGWHHGFVHYIPEPMLAQLRKIRSFLVSRRFRVVKEVSS
jgi:hypothetical protein